MKSTRNIASLLTIALLCAGCTLQEAKDKDNGGANQPPAAAPGSGMSAQTNAQFGTTPGNGAGSTGLGTDTGKTGVHSGEPTSTNSSQTVASSPAPSPGAPPGGPGGMMPPMAGGAGPTAPLTKTPEMDKKIAAAEKGGDKKKIAAAYAERGTFRMNDQDAGARVKYRAALDDYRKALAVDPANAEAAQNKKMIEDIYRSMGRPIPGEEGGAAKP